MPNLHPAFRRKSKPILAHLPTRQPFMDPRLVRLGEEIAAAYPTAIAEAREAPIEWRFVEV